MFASLSPDDVRTIAAVVSVAVALLAAFASNGSRKAAVKSSEAATRSAATSEKALKATVLREFLGRHASDEMMDAMGALAAFTNNGEATEEQVCEEWVRIFGNGWVQAGQSGFKNARAEDAFRWDRQRRRVAMLMRDMRVACEHEWISEGELARAFGPSPFQFYARFMPGVEKGQAARMGWAYNPANEVFARRVLAIQLPDVGANS